MHYTNTVYSFDFYFPPDANLTSAQDNHLQIYFQITPGTNLVEKYLELSVTQASGSCVSTYAATNAGTVVYNGHSFLVQTGRDQGAGQIRDIVAYSTLQGNVCVSFNFILHSGNIGNYPTSTPPFDQTAESAIFPQIVNTFNWLPATPTASATPTSTSPSSMVFTATYNFPKVTVNKAHAACLYGPATAYLWQYDLTQGDTGVVWGRAAASTWLYVKMDRWSGPCWVSPYVVDVQGDVNKMAVQAVRLPITNALYKAPANVQAVRNGDQVTITWNQVAMTVDDDRGYFLDVWVCQNGNYVWMPTAKSDQYQTSATFTDQAGCSYASNGKLYTVEKHGYTDPVTISWPPH
jgi:hypothetical protein